MPIRTLGLTHLSLAARDLERTLRFYVDAFGVTPGYRDDTTLELKGPGEHDILIFNLHPERAGQSSGMDHFGLRLVDPGDIDEAVAVVSAAGGTLLRRGEHGEGLPYAYFADPDGYEIEVWYEP